MHPLWHDEMVRRAIDGDHVNVPLQHGHGVVNVPAPILTSVMGATPIDTCVSNWTRAFDKEHGDDWAPISATRSTNGKSGARKESKRRVP